MDEVDIEFSLWTAVGTDFLYNIRSSFDGTARAPVINQGILIHELEKKILDTVKVWGSSCSLDTIVGALEGQSARTLLKNMLIANRTLEYYFKSVASGNIWLPAGISSNTLYKAIAENYSPDATSSCKNEYSFEAVIAKFLNEVNSNKKSFYNSLEGWEKGIRMFRGTDGTIAERNALQSKLLARELSRQWLSQNAQSIMMKNLWCAQIQSDKSSTPEEISRALKGCDSSAESMLQWVWNSMKSAFEKDYKKSGNTLDKYQKNTGRASAQGKIASDVAGYWKTIDATIVNIDETATNDQMLSDLANMHAQLVSINKLLKQKIPDMQKNCEQQWPKGINCKF